VAVTVTLNLQDFTAPGYGKINQKQQQKDNKLDSLHFWPRGHGHGHGRFISLSFAFRQ
jgi:hypothetical protein